MKKFLAIILTFVLCFGVLSVALAVEDDAVATVPDGYIGIYTAEDLDNVRNNLSGKYILMNNIDLSSYDNWNPIGTSETPFTGELNGNGYVLKNLIFNDKFSNAKDIDSGLFGYAKGAILSDVLIKNLSVKFDQSDSTEVYCTFGAVAGVARNSTIRSCAVSGKIDAENIAQLNISGIIGLPLYSKFENCANYADINVKLNNTALLLRIGGVAAFLRYTPLTESCNYGNITINGADVKLNKNFYIGGVYGDAADNFQNMTHDGDNYNRGTVSVDFSTSRTFIGGIAGQSYSVVNSYNAGKIIYPEDFAGFAGAVTGNAFECSLAINMPQRLTNVYYLNESMKDFSYGEHSYVDEEDDIFENIKYLTPEEMKKQESFVGFDFENVWAMEENGYPVLKNTPVIPETEKPGVTKPTTTTEPTTTETDSSVPDGYIGIYTAEDLDNVRNNLSGKYILMNDIDLSSYENWTPIGSSETPFTGELNGNGYSVENMTITVEQQEALNAGLFGYIKNSIVKNLTIKNGKIDVSANKGVNAGLVCGYSLSSKFSSVITNGKIDVDSKGILSTGGIVGYFYESFAEKGTAAVEQSSNHAEIAVSASIDNEGIYDKICIGGIVGYTNAVVSQCSNYSLISLALDKVDDDFSGSYLGGICGYTFGAVADCYNTGKVTANGVDSIYAGGISGYWEIEKSISNVHNTGKITASSTGEDARVSCYAFVGGARGLAYPAESVQDSLSAKNTYYLDNMETANEDYMSLLLILENVKKLTAEEFKKQNSFVGFDFDNTWVMDEELGHPVFKWEYEEESTEPSTTEPTTTPVTEPTTAEITTQPVTEPSTAEVTTQPVTVTTQPATEPSTTQPVTENESTTEPVTESPATPIEPSTEPTSEPDDNRCWVLKWLIKIFKAIIDWFVKLFVMLGF